MPDTGAPWNIPYVEAADLVSDWPADSLALANAIDAGLDAALLPGIGSNVVSVSSSVTFTTTSSTYVDDTPMQITFTPTSATSKVLLIYTLERGGIATVGKNIYARITAGGVQVGNEFLWTATQTYAVESGCISFLHSPATTSAIDYQIEVKRVDAGTASFYDRTFTAIEVAA